MRNQFIQTPNPWIYRHFVSSLPSSDHITNHVLHFQFIHIPWGTKFLTLAPYRKYYIFLPRSIVFWKIYIYHIPAEQHLCLWFLLNPRVIWMSDCWYTLLKIFCRVHYQLFGNPNDSSNWKYNKTSNKLMCKRTRLEHCMTSNIYTLNTWQKISMDSYFPYNRRFMFHQGNLQMSFLQFWNCWYCYSITKNLHLLYHFEHKFMTLI